MSMILGVHFGRRGRVSRIEIERAQIGGLELLGHRAALLLALEGGSNDAGQILGEGGWQPGKSRILQVTRAQYVFVGKEGFAIGVTRRELRIVERKQEGVGIWHPAEAWRLDAPSHVHAVGEHYLHAHLIEHPRGILVAFGIHDAPLERWQGARVLRKQVRISVAE